MSGFDSETTTPPRATASVAFARAVTDVDTRCTQLTTLLDKHELEHVVHVARSAADLWLTGRAAYRRIVDHEPATSRPAEAARRRLDAAFLRLLDLVRRAHTLSRNIEAQSRLDDIRIELVTAAAHPIEKTAPPAEPRRADDTQEMATDD